MFLLRNKKKISLIYPKYPFLSGALLEIVPGLVMAILQTISLPTEMVANVLPPNYAKRASP